MVQPKVRERVQIMKKRTKKTFKITFAGTWEESTNGDALEYFILGAFPWLCQRTESYLRGSILQAGFIFAPTPLHSLRFKFGSDYFREGWILKRNWKHDIPRSQYRHPRMSEESEGQIPSISVDTWRACKLFLPENPSILNTPDLMSFQSHMWIPNVDWSISIFISFSRQMMRNMGGKKGEVIRSSIQAKVSPCCRNCEWLLFLLFPDTFHAAVSPFSHLERFFKRKLSRVGPWRIRRKEKEKTQVAEADVLFSRKRRKENMPLTGFSSCEYVDTYAKCCTGLSSVRNFDEKILLCVQRWLVRLFNKWKGYWLKPMVEGNFSGSNDRADNLWARIRTLKFDSFLTCFQIDLNQLKFGSCTPRGQTLLNKRYCSNHSCMV